MNAEAQTGAALPPDIDGSAGADPPEVSLVRALADWLAEHEDVPPGVAERAVARCYRRIGPAENN